MFPVPLSFAASAPTSPPLHRWRREQLTPFALHSSGYGPQQHASDAVVECLSVWRLRRNCSEFTAPRRRRNNSPASCGTWTRPGTCQSGECTNRTGVFGSRVAYVLSVDVLHPHFEFANDVVSRIHFHFCLLYVPIVGQCSIEVDAKVHWWCYVDYPGIIPDTVHFALSVTGPQMDGTWIEAHLVKFVIGCQGVQLLM